MRSRTSITLYSSHLFRGNLSGKWKSLTIKYSQTLYAKDMPYHFSDSLSRSNLPPSFSLLDFRNGVFFPRKLMARKSLDTRLYLARNYSLLSPYRTLERKRAREREREMALFTSFLYSVEPSTNTRTRNKAFLLALHRRRNRWDELSAGPTFINTLEACV